MQKERKLEKKMKRSLLKRRILKESDTYLMGTKNQKYFLIRGTEKREGSKKEELSES